jgi:Flp pilus assembly protein TadD
MLGDADRALSDYDAALRINPKNADAWYGRGLAKKRRGDADGGNADIAAAKAITPGIGESFADQYGLK